LFSCSIFILWQPVQSSVSSKRARSLTSKIERDVLRTPLI